MPRLFFLGLAPSIMTNIYFLLYIYFKSSFHVLKIFSQLKKNSLYNSSQFGIIDLNKDKTVCTENEPSLMASAIVSYSVCVHICWQPPSSLSNVR